MNLTTARRAHILRRIAHLALAWGAMLLAGCGSSAHYPVNAPLGHEDAKEGYRLQRVAHDPANPGDVLVVLSLSGGGMRAAALAYGTLEALRDTTLPIGGTKRRLLDEVDIINAVSGGSIVAADYALYRDGIFSDFRDRFLRRDVERDLQLRAATNAGRLASKHFGRTDLLAEYFDDILFEGKTFGDLAHGPFRPFVVINASDLSTGARFPFTQTQFDLLCSDLEQVPLSRAVAASAALPPYFTAITLRNYAGSCNATAPRGFVAAAQASAEASGQQARVREAHSYRDVARRPYIHLVDGGLIDNLGVRASIDFAVENGGFLDLMDVLGYRHLTHAVFISVNAQRAPDLSIDQSDEVPSFRRVMRAFELPVNAQSLQISEQLRASFARWRDEIGRHRSSPSDERAEGEPRFYFIDISLQAIPDETERDYFKQIPTTLSLDAATVDRLRAVARKLLVDSPDFKKLVADLGG
ncbi:MAG TPA: patatin-like phospholipase family protein [Casimicrobiaceae bacterium]